MAEKFGKTWWSNEWLKSLSHIDFDNRIPRGATYARKGAVVDIKIDVNTISARVKGSRPTPYKEKITVPLYDRKQIDSLMDSLAKHPAVISKLLNRELDPQLLDICKELGLKVFPEKWNDFKMDCSCPDWAVPCKHLAAVIYVLSREIDNNPFLVFEMHGVDLIAELEKRNIKIEKDEILSVPDFLSVLKIKEKENPHIEYPDFPKIDYTRLHDITVPLANLLEKNPPFYRNGDFLDKYIAELQFISRKAQRIIHGTQFPDFEPYKSKDELDSQEKAYFYINRHGVVLKADNPDGEINLKKSDCNRLLDSVVRIPVEDIDSYHPTIQALHIALYCALHYLDNGSIVPQIVAKTKDVYMVRWLPATMSEEVDNIMKTLSQSMTPDLMKFVTTPKGKNVTSQLENQTECLVSFLLGELMKALSRYYVDNCKVFEMFFQQKDVQFDKLDEKSIPASIRAWTDRLFLCRRELRPSLLVEETDDGRFLPDIAIDHDGEPVLLKDILNDKKMESRKFAILKELSLLSSLIEGIGGYINDSGKNPIEFDTESFAPFLLTTIPAIRLLGVRVMLPKSLQTILRPKASIRISQKSSNDGKRYIRLDDLLQFDWQIAIGDETMSEKEFMQLVGKANGLIKIKQQYFYVSPEDIERLRNAMLEQRNMTASQMLQAALSEELDGAKVSLTKEVRALMRQLTEQSEIPVPKQINATLRPYQERGFSWMYRNYRIGFGSIIADDMGLGKTLQVITLLQQLKNDNAIADGKRVLIAVPTGLVSNWQREIARFAPELSVFTYHGASRNIKNFGTDCDILLTTYGVLRSDASKIKKLGWLAVIIDEAQNIKNVKTAQTKAVRSVPAQLHIAMSGTPVENRLSEFWSIMDFANQGYLGTAQNFAKEYSNPIQRDGDRNAANRFKKITAPFLLRRLKTDKSIISDLPDKIEQNEPALLTESQAALYQETLHSAMEAITSIDGTDSKSLFKRQGLVLQMILALKQICNHPSLFLKDGCHDAELSGKSEMLLSMLEGIVGSGQKVLVFTQFKEMGDMLSDMIRERLGERPLFLHGGCSIKKRQEMVDRFQNNPRADRIFLLSLKAAGTGLNLTAASHVIHYDLWWNPAVEAQATDRAYRIGQHQNVLVHRFITQNTFEERIDKMIQDKRNLADLTVATGESWIGKMSNEELHEIFG